jgi:hypothetical protein
VDKIIQIIPAAPNWWAHYRDTGEDFECPIAAWALIEDKDGYRWIAPVDPTGKDWDGSPLAQEHEIVYRPDGPPDESLWRRGPVADLDHKSD